MLRVLEVTFPVFALVFCGFFGQRLRLLPERAVEGINAFVFAFALPAMLFRIVATQPASSFTDLRFAAAFIVAGLAVYFFARAAAGPGPSRPTAIALTAAHGNIGYLGVPLVLELGREHAPTVILAIICDVVVVIMLSIALLERDRRHGADGAARAGTRDAMLRGVVRSPILLSIAAGLAWTIAAPPMPPVLGNFVRLLSEAAAPCALFAIGASLGARRVALTPTVRSLIVLKLVVHPAVAAIVLGLAGVAPAAAAIGVLVASLPSASNAFIIAQRYGVDAREISAAIVAGTFAALGTVSIVIWLLGLKAG